MVSYSKRRESVVSKSKPLFVLVYVQVTFLVPLVTVKCLFSIYTSPFTKSLTRVAVGVLDNVNEVWLAVGVTES